MSTIGGLGVSIPFNVIFGRSRFLSHIYRDEGSKDDPEDLFQSTTLLLQDEMIYWCCYYSLFIVVLLQNRSCQKMLAAFSFLRATSVRKAQGPILKYVLKSRKGGFRMGDFLIACKLSPTGQNDCPPKLDPFLSSCRDRNREDYEDNPLLSTSSR